MTDSSQVDLDALERRFPFRVRDGKYWIALDENERNALFAELRAARKVVEAATEVAMKEAMDEAVPVYFGHSFTKLHNALVALAELEALKG